MSQDLPGTARKVVAAYFLSLDGVAEAPDRFITTWDDETDASGADSSPPRTRSSSAAAATTSGRGSGPAATIQPFAAFINAVPKYVATSTPLEGDWANSQRHRGRPRRLRAAA